jgi:hypothetical protein
MYPNPQVDGKIGCPVQERADVVNPSSFNGRRNFRQFWRKTV